VNYRFYYILFICYNEFLQWLHLKWYCLHIEIQLLFSVTFEWQHTYFKKFSILFKFILEDKDGESDHHRWVPYILLLQANNWHQYYKMNYFYDSYTIHHALQKKYSMCNFGFHGLAAWCAEVGQTFLHTSQSLYLEWMRWKECAVWCTGLAMDVMVGAWIWCHSTGKGPFPGRVGEREGFSDPNTVFPAML
jgi:hypothetical protein